MENECPKCKRINGKHFACCDDSRPDHYHLPLEGGGHATFPTPPNKETIEAVKVAVKLAKKLKK